MTSSPVDAGRPWERVRNYLTGTLPDCDVTTESLVSGEAPMIFTWMAQLMAGFACSNGDAGASYRKLFGSFKDYYAENRIRLDDLELSFVFCVEPDLPNLEKFCSEVETDVYFCRKFVVPLTGSLDRSFGRLPFLPLALGTGRLQRPPSAQTYMRQCEVPATLAKYLAIPHQRGAENIVRDCLDEGSNWTPILASQSGRTMSRAESQDEKEESVRFDAVAIQNFRAYKRRQVFDLGRAVTVLYGPNGFGKTSVFDAIDFAATGGVGRLRLSASTDRFARAVAHLDSKPQDAVVDLSFGANGTARRIVRGVASRAHASLDGSTYDRKRALVEVTGGGVEPTDRIEHLVSLFRATHLFSQGDPELAKGFNRDCALPPQVVSHMLAFDDYANARSKATEVCDVLERASVQANRNVEILKDQIEEAELAIGNVEQGATQYEQAAAPSEALGSLRKRVQEAGLAVPAEAGDRVFVRACRAAIQARRADGEARIRRLTSLVEEIRILPSVENDLAELAKRRHRTERELAAAAEALGQAEASQSEARELLQESGARRVQGRTRAEALRWVTETQPRYNELLKVEIGTGKAVQEARGDLRRLRERRLVVARELRGKEQSAGKVAAGLARGRRGVADLRRLVDAAGTWRADLAAVRSAGAREEALARQLEDLRKEERSLSSGLAENRTARGRLQAEIEGFERQRSEFSQLLGRVEDRIRDAFCPLCGHDHGSVEVLREQVDRQRVLDPAAAVRGKLGLLREDGEKLTRSLEEVRENVAAQSREGEELREEREAREGRIAGFADAVGKVGITAEDPAVTVKEINDRWTQERGSVVDMERVGAASHVEVEGARRAVAELDQEIEEGEKIVLEMERDLEDCRGEIGRLRGDPRAAGVSLDTKAATLREVGDRQMEELKKMDAAVAEAAGAAKERAGTVRGLRQRVSALTTSLEGLKKGIGARRRTVTEAKARLTEFGITGEAEGRDVTGLLETATKANRELAELLDFADGVEVAMDTATTAAALRQQRQGIRERQRRIAEMQRDIETNESWRRYFAEVKERVAGKQNAAIASFADEYGPTANAIQERLRSVYGFDGIDTRSHEATIRVRVRRGKEVFRPTDYFSDSQQRTLLLGLFLTAAISQSWSALSTVLLDDPVMHFDDLNTYAFLDMVAGLLSAGSGPQQFIISTCDRRVLQLARKRFRHLERDARFYEFTAIGRDGPVVEEIGAV